MKPVEVRALSDVQINETLDALREEWRALRFDDAVGRLTHTKRIREIRRDIARLKTIQTERVMAAELEERIGSGAS
jgi:large subunit ribosomal protein L29